MILYSASWGDDILNTTSEMWEVYNFYVKMFYSDLVVKLFDSQLLIIVFS